MTAPDTRALILDAFADQLAAAGYPGISLVGVARTAGIQKPSMYHHFPGGKEEMYTEVALRFITDLGARVQDAVAVAGGLRERLVALAVAAADHGASAVSFEQRVYDTLDHVTEATRTLVMRRYADGVLGPVVGLFRGAVDAGEVHGDPEFLMNAFLHLARATDHARAVDEAPRIVELFLDGARAERTRRG